MRNLNLKLKIAILWLFMAIAYSAHMMLSIFEPGVIELITSGEMQLNEGEFIFSALFAWLVPLTMALLSVTLKDLANRRANIVMGITLTAVNIFHLL